MLWKRRAPWQGGCRAFDGLPCTARAMAKQAPRRAIFTLTSAARTIGRSNSRAPRGTRRSSAGCSTNCRAKWSGGAPAGTLQIHRAYRKRQQTNPEQATSRTRSSSFSSTTTKCGRGIQADSEARRCRGDEVSKGQHCKSRKEKTLEVRVQVHEAHSTASREPSMTDAAGTFQEGLWNWLRRQNVELLEPPEIGSRTCQSVCAVGRTMSSLTSTSAGCSMANVTARAMASASIAVSVRGLSASAVSASVT